MKRLTCTLLSLLLLLLSAVPALAADVADASSEPPTGAGVTVADTPETAALSDEQLLAALTGIWEGGFPVYRGETSYYLDKAVLDFNPERPQPLLIQVDSIDPTVYVPPQSDMRIQDGRLIFDFYEGAWHSAVSLSVQPDGSLFGSYVQNGRTTPVTFTRTSLSPSAPGALQTQFVFDGRTGAAWLQELRQYPDYTTGGQAIPYSYELLRWDKSLPLINLYNVGSVMDGRSDVEQMIALLNIVSDNFKHDGQIALGEKMDPLSVVAQHNEDGGIECRGLSVILSEMLRVCGIEAKPVMCIPSIEPSECHVVVHAYSASLGQWVMLDPTFRLILQNDKGQYLSLPMLRQTLIDGGTLIANDNAGRNGAPIYMPYYREYMTKNTFRFANATHFYFGGERFADTDVKGETNASAENLFGEGALWALSQRPSGNPMHMLAPKGYTVPYLWSRSEKVTTSAESFWAPPQ